MERLVGLKPFGAENAQILILGSMPSTLSLREQMYYANPTNRFWPMMEALTGMPVQTNRQKEMCLKTKHILLWDVIGSCTRTGSSDASIRNIEVNAIDALVDQHSISLVVCNGKLSEKTMKKYYPEIPVTACPSTSAANARWRLEDLVQYYGRILGDDNGQ